MLIRNWVSQQLDVELREKKTLSLANKFLVGAILVAVFLSIIETESTIRIHIEWALNSVNMFFGILFTVEYLARFWVSGLNPKYQGMRGKFRFIFASWALIDLIAILPFWVLVGANDIFVIRLVRILRIFSIAKIGRYSEAQKRLAKAIVSRRFELFVTLKFAFFIMVISASFMYLAEHSAQPDTFGSIPRTLWWSVVTLTTVGYGDVYPITAMGKLFAAITAIATIGLVAMPAGILAAAFSEAFGKKEDF